MSRVQVGIPLSKIMTRLTVRRGRSWSVAERLILEGLSSRERTRSDIIDGVGLEPQIVDACLMRLMRAEWVSMFIMQEKVWFRATPQGSRALMEAELPFFGHVRSRTVPLLYDRIAGHVFDLNTLQSVQEAQSDSQAELGRIIKLEPVLDEGRYRLDELIDVVLTDDEQLLGVDAATEASVPALAIVQVIDGRIGGLPAAGHFPELERAVFRALDGQSLDQARHPELRRRMSGAQPLPVMRDIRFDLQDLVVSGAQHRRALIWMLRHARSRVIIHSTFLGEDCIRELLPVMFESIARGVSIDILWGQQPRSGSNEATRSLTAEEIAQKLRLDDGVVARGDKLRIHEYSTGSHAKIVLADAGSDGEFVAIVGSCNWLASPFKAVEASVYLHTPTIVCDVVRCLTRLIQAANGGHDALTNSLLQIVQRLERRPVAQPNAKASVVTGDGHNNFVLRARDEARKRIFVTSHRLGRKISPGILEPLSAARAARDGLAVTAIYGRLQPDISQLDAKRILSHAAARKIGVHRIYEPKIHAKVLVWDDDTTVITSQNWLSADPPSSSLASELGIAIRFPGIGRNVVDQLRACVHGGGAATRRGRSAARRKLPRRRSK